MITSSYMVILPGSMLTFRLREWKRRFADFRRVWSARSSSTSRLSVSKTVPVTQNFTLSVSLGLFSIPDNFPWPFRLNAAFLLRSGTPRLRGSGLGFCLPMQRSAACGGFSTSLAILAIITFEPRLAANPSVAYGLSSRPHARPFLGMPSSDKQAPPPLLSQTGAFQNTQTLTPIESLIPYDINVPFYSDGAVKSRWVCVPSEGPVTNTRIHFAATGEWQFPPGTVFVKEFEMATNETRPEKRRRLETRLLVLTAGGGVYGATYK